MSAQTDSFTALAGRAEPSPVGKAARAAPIPRPPRRWRTRVLVPGLLLGGMLVVLVYSGWRSLQGAVEVRVVPVVVKAADGSAPTDDGSAPTGGDPIVQAPGWIEPDPFPTYVAALAEGVVKQVLVLEGQRVEADQVVARLVDDDARLGLSRAEADVEAGHAEIAQLEAEVALEQARLDEARDEVERISKSAQQLAAASGELSRARLRAVSQERALEATRARTGVVQANLRNREAARDEAALRLSRMEVRSPIAGVVMSRLVEPGSRIMHLSDDMHASHVIRLYDPSRLQVRVDIPLSEAAKVGVGQRAEIVTEALPDRVFHGVVTRRVDEANIQKNTVQVKVAIEDPSPVLRPEMLARVRFFGAGSGGAAPERSPASTALPAAGSGRLFVAREALMHAADGQAHAWVVDRARETVTLRAVRYGGGTPDGWIEVLEGLKPGDRVVVGDTGRLREGARVRVTGEAASTHAGHGGKG